MTTKDNEKQHKSEMNTEYCKCTQIWLNIVNESSIWTIYLRERERERAVVQVVIS